MKKNEIIETIIEDMKFPNKGISRIDGKKVIIKNGIKGQRVKVRITKNRREQAEGTVVEIVEKSPMEKPPLCEHFGICGGCTYQTLPYKEQLDIKKEQVLGLLNQAGITGYEFLGIEPSPTEYGYRNKMEFSFGDVVKGGELALGMHKRGSFYEVVTVEGCVIVDEDFNKVLLTVLSYFREKKIPFYHNRRHEGSLRHLVVRKASRTGQMLINLVTSSQIPLELEPLVEILSNMTYDGQLKGILHTINDGLSDVVKSDKTNILYGQDYFIEEIMGLKFRVSAFSFFQTNSLGAEKLYSMVRGFAGTTRENTVLDLYCGTGTIAQIMAPASKKVIGIEIVEEAVEAARENAKLNGLVNCDFIAGDVLKKLDELTEKPDIIVLDPPRDGIHPKAIKKIIHFGARQMVYVSCKPTSLARDLKEFMEAGYEVTKVQCMDMFPHTYHVETVVQLIRK